MLWGSKTSAQSVPFLQIRSPTNVPTPHDVEMHLGTSSACNVGSTCTHRYDLDEDGGEIVEVRVVSDFEALSTEMAHWSASNNVRDVFHCQVDQMGGYFAPFSMQSSLHIRIYQQSAGKFLKKSDFERPEACILIASGCPYCFSTSFQKKLYA